MFDEGITIEMLPTLRHNKLQQLGVATLDARATFMAAVKLPEDVPPEPEPEPQPQPEVEPEPQVEPEPEVEVERTFATSNFKREYDTVGIVSITLAAQIIAKIGEFIHLYCHVHVHNLTAEDVHHGRDLAKARMVAAKSFVTQLLQQVATRPDGGGNQLLGDVQFTAELLWTSCR